MANDETPGYSSAVENAVETLQEYFSTKKGLAERTPEGFSFFSIIDEDNSRLPKLRENPDRRVLPAYDSKGNKIPGKFEVFIRTLVKSDS
jgi:hypothetical protein